MEPHTIMPHVDARGVAMSGATPEALAAFEASLARLVGGERDPLAPLDAMLGDASDFAMGHALRAGAAIMADESPDAPALLRAVRAIERDSAATERELRHARAARAYIEGDGARALALYGEIAVDLPRDLLALRVAHAL